MPILREVMMFFVRKTSLRRRPQAGIGLISALVGAGIASMVVVMLSKVILNSVQGSQHVELRNDLEAIRNLISMSLSCEDTLVENGITNQNRASRCQSTSQPGELSGPYLQLMRATADGSTRPMGTFLQDNTLVIGNWHIRAGCSEAEQSLVIRAARPLPDGQFAKDPLTNRVMNWESPNALLFGIGPRAMPLCFSGTPKTEVAEVLYTAVCTASSSTHCGNYILDIIYPQGPSDAFIPLPNLTALYSQSRSGLPFHVDSAVRKRGYCGNYYVRGFACNAAKGWRIAMCNTGKYGDDSDTFYWPNGCVTNDFDGHHDNCGEKSTTELRVVCVR